MSYLDGSLILTAGKATNGDCLQDVWISTDGVNWALGPLPGWAPRHGHRMVVVDVRIDVTFPVHHALVLLKCTLCFTGLVDTAGW